MLGHFPERGPAGRATGRAICETNRHAKERSFIRFMMGFCFRKVIDYAGWKPK